MNRSDVLQTLSSNSGKPRWGIECDDGWLPLILEIHEYLLNVDPSYLIVQIKEKFGGLRYYFSLSNRCNLTRDQQFEVTQAVDRIADRSYEICERCGGLGELSETGWRRITCDDCLPF